MNATRDAQTTAIYACIGRFVVEYSQLIHWIKAMLAHSMARGPDHVHEGMMHDLLEDVPDGAPVRMLGRHLRLPAFRSPEDNKVIDEILGRISATEGERNQLLHSEWFVGWGNEQSTDWSQAERVKAPTRRKLGEADKHSHVENESTIAARVRKLCELREDALRLITMGMMRRDANVAGAIARNFVLDPDGRYRPPHGSRQSL